MVNEVVVRRYIEGDEDEVIDLLDLVFDNWPSFNLDGPNIDHWCWKFRDNYIEKCVTNIAEFDGKIVGVCAETYHCVKIGDVLVDCGIGADIAIHPDFRGQGLWSRMVRQAEAELKSGSDRLIYYLTGNPIVIKSMSKVRPRMPFGLTNYVRILDIDKHFEAMPMDNEMILKAGFLTLKLASTIRTSLRSAPETSASITVSLVDSFDKRIDNFWSDVSREYSFIGKRDYAYLNHRYCDPRSGNFTILLAEGSDDEVLGYAVIQINTIVENYPVGFILDLIALPDRLDVVDALLNECVCLFDAEDVNIVNYLQVKGHPYNEYVGSHGFLDSMVNFDVFYNTYQLNDEMKALQNTPESKVFFSWGDHDSLPMSIKRK